jgi:hypothetical protein
MTVNKLQNNRILNYISIIGSTGYDGQDANVKKVVA